jgi:CHAT domain-containing protein
VTTDISPVENLTEELLAQTDAAGQRRWLAEHVLSLPSHEQDALADALKGQSNRLMQSDIDRCLQVASLIHEMAELAQNPSYRALALVAEGNAYVIGLGQYQQGIPYYDEAAAIYAQQGQVAKQAQSQTGKIWALANLGRYDEAMATGEWASDILEQHGEWLALAKLTSNLALLPGRLGKDAEALDLFDRARDLYRQLGPEGELPVLRVEINRAIILRNLGRFEESISVNQAVLEAYDRLELDRPINVARAQQNLAITYFLLGRYNESLALLDEARETFLADGRQRHAMVVELSISDCLLQLRRFGDVLEKSARVRELSTEIGSRFEVAQAVLNEASANYGLKKYDDALASLAEARSLFEEEGNQVAVAEADLQTAAVLLALGQHDESLAQAQAAAAVFQEHDLPLGRARAHLVAGRAAMASGQYDLAQELASLALLAGERHTLPTVIYQAHSLRADLNVLLGDPEQGLIHYERAIQELEHLFGRLMIEYRADFAEDKGSLYEDIVALCLDLDRPQLGLEYSERAKSRALQDMIGRRLNLRIEARSESDEPLVQEMLRLRAERDRRYRRWESGERISQRGGTDELLEEQRQVEQEVLDLENQITELWHRLLIRNADYARDAALWQVRAEPIQPYLDNEAALLQYFVVHGHFVVFLVTAGEVRAYRLPATLAEVQNLLQLFWLNLKAIPRTDPGRYGALAHNAQGILFKLYRLLFEPLVEQLAPYERLIIVPHGSLHYLPFHALHDGQAYLLQGYEFSYLPGSSMLRYSREAKVADGGLLAMGHSYGGRLPYAVEEASTIGELWDGQLALEEAATLTRFVTAAPEQRILHLATHGDFRPDNPVFSGLALADGWLTTLDIFNQRLQASLVTLSACQTGRSVVAGGDELLGLMRAFLGAGAASLVATLWAVEDSSTAQIMEHFYRNLAQGHTKGQALRDSQLSLIQAESATGQVDGAYRHPYFWAPFFLVGDAGPI